MTRRKESPIAKKIIELLNAGTTVERICVACYVGMKHSHIKYNTLRNILRRGTVSADAMAKLRAGNVINQEDIKQYELWLKDIGYWKKRGRKDV